MGRHDVHGDGDDGERRRFEPVVLPDPAADRYRAGDRRRAESGRIGSDAKVAADIVVLPDAHGESDVYPISTDLRRAAAAATPRTQRIQRCQAARERRQRSLDILTELQQRALLARSDVVALDEIAAEIESCTAAIDSANALDGEVGDVLAVARASAENPKGIAVREGLWR